MMTSSGDQEESFDPSVQYFAGNFIGSDVTSSRDGVHDDDGVLSQKTSKSGTVPRPFHFMTTERHGNRSYSSNSSRIEDRKAYIEKRKEALRRAHDVNFNRKLGRRERKPTVPQLPRLMTMEKNGIRNYSTNSKKVETTQGSSSSVPRRRGRRVTVPKPPRLVTLAKNGARNYSTFSGNRSHGDRSVDSMSLFETRSYDHQSFGSKSRRSHRKATIPRPPRLRTTEKNGERLYSFSSTPWMQQNMKNRKSWNGRPLSVTVPVPFHLSSSPFKHASRDNTSTSRFTFKALPLPNFDYQPFGKRNTNNKLATVPQPFHLTMKAPRARSYSPSPRHRFKALPLPDFNVRSRGVNGTNKRLATVPQPFDLSEMTIRPRGDIPQHRRRFRALALPTSSMMTRRARSHSPPRKQRQGNNNVASARMSRLEIYNASKKYRDIRRPKNPRSKRKVFPAKPPLKRRRSLKSKHRFSEKHQGKEFKLRGMNKSKSKQPGRSVNPNLNAGIEARRKHMDQVSLEVALLREEWRLYKEEAERALMEMEKAKKEKARKRKKLKVLTEQRTMDKSDRERARLIKHIANLEKFIKYKSDIHAEFSQKMEENERRRRRISLRFKDNFIKSESDICPTALTVRGKHRNIRRSSEVRARETGCLLNLFTDDENDDSLGSESFSESDEGLQNQSHGQSLSDSQYEERENILVESSDVESPYRSEDLSFDLIQSRDNTEEGSHNEERQSNKHESGSFLNEDGIEDAITTIPDTASEQLGENLFDHKTEPQNVSDENNNEDAVMMSDTALEQLGQDHDDHKTESGNISEEGNSADDAKMPDTTSELLGQDHDDHKTESRNISDEDNSAYDAKIPDTTSELLGEDHDDHKTESENISDEDNSADDAKIPDTTLELLGEDHDDQQIESRNTSDEASSQRLANTRNEDNYFKSGDTAKNEPVNKHKEFRQKGDFGDDFEVSELTNLFRGGWHRAMTHEHLSESSLWRS